jgi:hypothetical protein
MHNTVLTIWSQLLSKHLFFYRWCDVQQWLTWTGQSHQEQGQLTATLTVDCFVFFYFFNHYNKLPDMLSDEEVSVVVYGSAAYFLKSWCVWQITKHKPAHIGTLHWMHKALSALGSSRTFFSLGAYYGIINLWSLVVSPLEPKVSISESCRFWGGNFV